MNDIYLFIEKNDIFIYRKNDFMINWDVGDVMVYSFFFF